MQAEGSSRWSMYGALGDGASFRLFGVHRGEGGRALKCLEGQV